MAENVIDQSANITYHICMEFNRITREENEEKILEIVFGIIGGL